MDMRQLSTCTMCNVFLLGTCYVNFTVHFTRRSRTFITIKGIPLMFSALFHSSKANIKYPVK